MGGQKYKERGGGPATGLANDTIGFLQSGLMGTFGGGAGMAQTSAANPIGSTQGMAAVLNDILSGGAGTLGGSMGELISRDVQRNADALRARFGAAGGGAGMGTPGAYAEALYRSESAPRLTQAIGGLQLQALMPIMQMIASLSGKGISQREGFMQPSGWSSTLATLAPVAGAMLGGPIGGMIGGGIGGMFGGGGLTLPGGGMGPTPYPGLTLPPIPGL